ncbi:MAG: hypothetical protein WBB39_03585 [Candidatus Saccharimonadales bacterium]
MSHQIDLADIATQRFTAEALGRVLNQSPHRYTIVWSEGEKVFATTDFVGTGSARVAHMRDHLMIDVDHGQWAAAYWDDRVGCWRVSGTSLALRQLLQQRTAPIRR